MRCFSTTKNKIEKRLDVDFYHPNYTDLEEKISHLTTKTLGNYIVSIAGGATPSKSSPELYYTEDNRQGIPFLRVQNLSTSGQCDLASVKYINLETHENLLKRSQVDEDDLLIKITGVGRMAVASVPPKGFKGNINQHIVRIKTESREISTYLAAYLNTDIGEQLASRRSTGGTRPALDYEALKSIPIVFSPEILHIIEKAEQTKKQKETEAQRLLDSIDDYVLSELGIELPEFEHKMCFSVQAGEVEEKRVDPSFYRYELSFQSNVYDNALLSSVAEINPKTEIKHFSEDDQVSFISMDAISEHGFIKYFETREIKKSKGYTLFKEGDLLFAKITPCMENGKTSIAQGLKNKTGIGSTEFHVIRSNDPNLSIDYLHTLVRTKYLRLMAENSFIGSSGHRRVPPDFFETLSIPIPKIKKQLELSNEVKKRIRKSEALKQQAQENLDTAKAQVEKIILGDTDAPIL